MSTLEKQPLKFLNFTVNSFLLYHHGRKFTRLQSETLYKQIIIKREVVVRPALMTDNGRRVKIGFSNYLILTSSMCAQMS